MSKRHPIDLFRAAFGLVLTALAARYFAHGWIDAQFHAPRHLFPWEGLEWIRPWPRPWMHAHLAALGLLAAGLAAGSRLCAGLFCAGFTYLHLIDRTNYLNHYYLISLMSGLLAALPRGKGPPPAWTVALLRFQVGAVYVFAGLAKLQGDWLLRGQPLRIWTADVGLLAAPGVAAAMSWAGALFDLALPFLLLVPRTRPWAFAAGVAFHAATALLFPIGLFPWIMTACLLVFLPGETSPAPPPRLARGFATAWALVQVLVPLRCWASPGDVLWTEDGFRFSWRVMVAEKAARACYWIVDEEGRAREVDAAAHLTPLQAHAVPAQPDLLRSFLAKLRSEAGGRAEAAACVSVSLNGRPSRASCWRLGPDGRARPAACAPASHLASPPGAPERIAVGALPPGE